MNLRADNAPYLEIMRLKFHEFVAYPLLIIGEWISFPLVMGIFYIVYGTLYQGNPYFAGMSFYTLMVYLGLAHAFTKMGDPIGIGYEMNQEISKGEILKYLTRPISYFGVWFANQAGRYLAMGAVMMPLLYLFCLALGFAIPLEKFIASVLVATFGGIVFFQIHYIVGLIAFWIEEAWGIRWAISTIAYFFSGATIPIILFPPLLQDVAYGLPFLYQAGIPAQFALGQIGWDELGKGVLILLIWMIALHLLQKWVWKKGLEKNDGKG